MYELFILLAITPLFLILHAVLWRRGIRWMMYAGMVVSVILLAESWIRISIACEECSKTFALCCEWVGIGILLEIGLTLANIVLLGLFGGLINRSYQRRAGQNEGSASA